MSTSTSLRAGLFAVATALAAPTLAARELSFDERVEAQEAIERVYYSHQDGASRAFEAVVPRAVLEQKVRKYLAQSIALEDFWGTRVSTDMLEREVERMVRETRMPARLSELFAALGNDGFLVQECLARPLLVDRLARSFFSTDERLHGPAGQKAETSWDAWWERTRDGLDLDRLRSVASSGAGLPPFASDGAESSCFPSDTWNNGNLGSAARADHTAVWTGSVMIAWGGYDGESWFDTGARYDPATDSWTPTSRLNRPSARTDHTAIWTGSVMVVWGGYDGTKVLGTGGVYDPVADAWTATSLVGAPSPREDHTAVWTGSRMLVWGGHGGGFLATGGSYDPVADTWTPISTANAPSARVDHTAVWMAGRMIVWGGYDAGSSFGSGGRYDPASDTWMPTSLVNAPAPRRGHAAVVSAGLMVVWGGRDASYLNTGGRYDPAADSWTPTSTSGAPTVRAYYSAVSTGNQMIVWGGDNGQVSTLNTGGRYDTLLDTWTTTAITNAPSAREHHTAVWTGSLMLVWGGQGTFNSFYSDTGGRYDPDTDSWTPTSPTSSGPSERQSHTGVWTGSLMIVWGGENSLTGVVLETGASYDPATDSWIPTSLSNAPSARTGHTAVWTGERMVVWGGTTDYPNYPLFTGALYDPVADTWTPTANLHVPAARRGHTAVWTGSAMIVWGGWGDFGAEATGGQYDPTINEWIPTSTAGAPDGRSDHTAVWTGSEMLVWGGLIDGVGVNSGGRYDPASDSWTAISTSGAPNPTSGHAAVWTGSRMIVWGSAAGPNYDGMGGRYDPAADSWTPTALDSAVSQARWGFPPIWTGHEMIIWGGYSVGGPWGAVNTGARYDPETDTWAPTSSVGAPKARYTHTAVWTGAAMIVWGGSVAAGQHDLDTGGLYALGGSSDDDGDGFAECEGDCDASDGAIFPGASPVCDGIENDCSSSTWPAAPGEEVDNDGDGYVECEPWIGPSLVLGGGDCDDAESATHPGAPEVNDGKDNQCSGLGYGVQDEVSGEVGFTGPTTTFTWTAQAGAVLYGVARSPHPDLHGACVETQTSSTSWTDPGVPGPGGVFYYLVRTLFPHLGSWGQDSAGVERTQVCAGP